MTELQSQALKSDFKKMRVLLIILTLIEISYLIVAFTNVKLWIKIDFDYKINWVILGLNLIVSGIFIWYNWTKMPIEKKNKSNNTFLILFLGTIGMWLWIPNKRELKKLIEK